MRTFLRGFMAVWLLFFVLSTIAGCSKSLNGEMAEGQVALTFDDSSLDNWFAYLPLLDSLNIKATFYVSQYHKLTNVEKSELHIIAQHGHEIGYHTANHPNMQSAVRNDGLMKTMANEIDSDLKLMQKDGFTITNFAYPFGRHDQQLDIALFRYFKSVRAVSNHQNYSKSLVKHCGKRQVLYGADIDMCSNLNEEGMVSLLEQAHTGHDCIIFVGHRINTPDFKFNISVDRLRKLAREAKQRNLNFIPIRDITL